MKRARTFERAAANKQVFLTGAQAAEARRHFVPTKDPFDRAHGERDPGTGFLLPAAARTKRGISLLVAASEPRRYPRCYMTASGVSFESAFDDTHERQARLRELLGDDDVRDTPQAVIVEAALAKFEAAQGSKALRTALRGFHRS